MLKYEMELAPPVVAGLASVETQPPTETMSRVISTVVAVRISGVRESLADCRSSRIHTGLGCAAQRWRRALMPCLPA